MTLNTVDPALLARSCNRAQAYAELTTQDNQITRRRWLLIDADAERPAGISSTDAEHTAALSHVVAIRDTRSAQGWPLPVLADSGNGGHLLYRIDEPADDNGLIQRVLKAFAFYHDTAAIHIDQTVFNAARICKLYGTQAAKGDPTPERPHRIARIIEAPSTIAPVPHELLQALADSIPTDDGAKRTAFASQGADFDLEGWIKQ